MFAPTDQQLADFTNHAAACQPGECCGVIAGGIFVPIRNKAAAYRQARDMFVMDEDEYIAVSKAHRIEAICHSHVYLPPVASEGDRTMCEKLGLPWLILSWPLGTWRVFEPDGFRAPLVGRQWAWGTLDCFALVRDGFHDYAGIDLPEFRRDWYWWKEGGDLIRQHYAEAGFIRLPPETRPQHLDILGMQIGAPVVNHLGLFLAPDILLHQLMGRLSVREVYGGLYQDATVLHLRHCSLLDGAAP